LHYAVSTSAEHFQKNNNKKKGNIMPIELIVLGISLIAAGFGWLITTQIKNASSRVSHLESHQHIFSTQQARDDVKWENQLIVNAKVDINQNETAVLKSQVTTLHGSVDELKKDIKEVNNKLDVLIQRK
jgi:outer membrane murein-binding lipoprotein Lpp